MSADKLHFLTRRVQDFQRASSRQLQCSLCDNFTALIVGEANFLEHARKLHPEVAEEHPDGERWKKAVQEAAAKVKQRSSRKLVPEPTIEMSKRSSTDSMKLNVGDTRSQSTASRPVSALGPKQAESKLEEFKRLSIGQRPEQSSDVASSMPGLVPAKRPAAQSASHDSRHQGDGRGSPKNRRTKAGSGGPAVDADFDRLKKPGQSKRLFDPNSDGPSFARGQSIPIFSSARGRDSKGQLQRSPKKEVLPGKEPQCWASHLGLEPSSIQANIVHAGIGNLTPVEISTDQTDMSEDDEEPELLLQPETRPISHEQLVHEVKGIYAGLVMVETKCIDVDEKQNIAAQERDPSKRTQLTPEQWSALIALHKTLLHEHHDFFLASQHPSASPALTKLAEKYSMPARMWKHGIHAFLEVLRHRLPASLDHMLAFLYIAYAMMALLYETVPSFEDTWVECLGDLGRYRMAIGDEDVKDRDVWCGVARFWYSKAADKNPQIGRLHHHLAILARPFTIQQLSLYARSLTSVIPFEGAKTSIMTMFNPVLSGQQSTQFKANSVETILIKCLGLLYTGRSTEQYATCVQQLINMGMFEKYIERAGGKFKEIGVSASLAAIATLFEFGASRPKGSSRSIIRRAVQELKEQRDLTRGTQPSSQTSSSPSAITPNDELTTHEVEMSSNAVAHACKIAFGILSAGLHRPKDKNVLPMVNTYLTFISAISRSEKAMEHLENDIPWTKIASFLNSHASSSTITPTIMGHDFPKPGPDVIGRPLPEDFILRGQIYMEDCFPSTWFSDAAVDDEERVLELPSMAAPRLERILWNGHSIARVNKWLTYDPETQRFAATEYAGNLRPIELPEAFEPGSLPTEVESMISDPIEGEENVPYAVPDSPPRQRSPEPADEPRSRVSPFKATPTILKRRSRDDVEMKDSEQLASRKVAALSEERPRGNRGSTTPPNLKSIKNQDTTPGIVDILHPPEILDSNET